MRKLWRGYLGLAGLSLSLTAPISSSSASNTSTIIHQLKKSTDHRVRTLAALSLGVSDDSAATKPLCQCLGDFSEVESVRIACAAGLGKLMKTGCETCLKEHLDDGHAKVKSAIVEALRSISASAAPQAAPGASGVSASTCRRPAAKGKPKFYVGLSVSNKSNRPDMEVKPLVEKELRCSLMAAPGYLVAWGDDTAPKKMAAIIEREKLNGYFLSVALEPIQYDGAGLKVSLRMTVMTHTRDIKGELRKSLSMANVKDDSRQREESLIAAATERLTEDWMDSAQ
ncbi:MAG: hypothetical protein NVS3B20_14810 [Polyangiales bacterium]